MRRPSQLKGRLARRPGAAGACGGKALVGARAPKNPAPDRARAGDSRAGRRKCAAAQRPREAPGSSRAVRSLWLALGRRVRLQPEAGARGAGGRPSWRRAGNMGRAALACTAGGCMGRAKWGWRPGAAWGTQG